MFDNMPDSGKSGSCLLRPFVAITQLAAITKCHRDEGEWLLLLNIFTHTFSAFSPSKCAPESGIEH